MNSTSAARQTSARPPQRRPIGQRHQRRAAGISPAHIAAIKTASPIAEVVGQFVELRRQGSIFYGRCPWHASKSGRSFQISPEHRTWRCWAGCGDGDAFAFIRKFLGVSFPDAAIYLALRAGIDLSQPPSRELVKQVELRAAEEENRARLKEAELAEFRRIGGELTNARRLHRAAGDRLTAIERGAPVRFDDERDLCFAAIALASEELRDLDAAYCVVAFGKSDLRDRYVAHPEDRQAIIADVLEAGFVATEKKIRHRVGVQ